MFHKAFPKHVEYNILATLPHIQSTCSLASFRPYASAWKTKEERLYGWWFLIGWKDRFVWHQLVAKIPSSLMFWVSRTSDKSTRTLTDNDDGESNESYRNRTNLPPSSNTTCPLTDGMQTSKCQPDCEGLASGDCIETNQSMWHLLMLDPPLMNHCRSFRLRLAALFDCSQERKRSRGYATSSQCLNFLIPVPLIHVLSNRTCINCFLFRPPFKYWRPCTTPAGCFGPWNCSAVSRFSRSVCPFPSFTYRSPAQL